MSELIISGKIPDDNELSACDNTGVYSIKPPAFPTQKGPKGILFDFNDGARIFLPKGKWHVEIIDAESGNIIFACDSDGGWVQSRKKYFILFTLKVWERDSTEPFFEHTLDLKDKPVVVSFPVGTLGDPLGWFPYVERFYKEHHCNLECTLGQEVIDLLKDQYPQMKLNTPENIQTQKPYATYRVGLFFGGNTDNQPIDFRMVGLHRTAGYILGVDPTEEPPRLKLNAPRKIKDPYVCIAAQSSCQAKYWNNGMGWQQVVEHLKKLGYRVLCIDKHATYGQGFVWNHIPYGAEDFTGSIPLQERVDLLQHAAFLVGLSSGLSWLAWACRIPVVLISGFSLPTCEFYTPYRVYNSHGCMGCWDDITLNFDHKDFFWCPRLKNTERQYECTRLITGQQVIGHIDRLHLTLQQKGVPT